MKIEMKLKIIENWNEIEIKLKIIENWDLYIENRKLNILLNEKFSLEQNRIWVKSRKKIDNGIYH